MAEKVEKLGVRREKDFMYYVKDASVWKVQRKQPHVPKGRPEKVAPGSFKMDSEFIYFVDRDGDVSRAKRAVGGQKRKKTVVNPPGLKLGRASRGTKGPTARAEKARPGVGTKKASMKSGAKASKAKAKASKTSMKPSKTSMKSPKVATKVAAKPVKGSSAKSKGAKPGKSKGRK